MDCPLPVTGLQVPGRLVILEKLPVVVETFDDSAGVPHKRGTQAEFEPFRVPGALPRTPTAPWLSSGRLRFRCIGCKTKKLIGGQSGILFKERRFPTADEGGTAEFWVMRALWKVPLLEGNPLF
jgi:hypothetical protein